MKKAFLESPMFSKSDTNVTKHEDNNIQRKSSIPDTPNVKQYMTKVRNEKLLKTADC